MSRLMNFAGVLRLFKHIPWLKFICNWLICNVQLLILWATGILVIVRCFSHRESFDKEIAAHLGSSFSRMPYIILVVCDSISCFCLLHTTDLVLYHFAAFMHPSIYRTICPWKSLVSWMAMWLQRNEALRHVVFHIQDKLAGVTNSICIVQGSLTLLALVATLPLVQLFFFHMILIHKVQQPFSYKSACFSNYFVMTIQHFSSGLDLIVDTV